MKRFIFTVLSVSVFFVGLAAIVDRTGATFKSDEKALDLVRKARAAIGGESAISSVKSLRIVGQTTRSFKINGADTTEQGETEIAFQFPDKLMRTMKVGKDDGTGLTDKILNKQVDVIVVGDTKDKMKVTVNGEGHGSGTGTAHKIVIRKDDGTVQELTGDEAAKFIAKEHSGGTGGVHTITLKKKADGTVEQVGGHDDKVIIRKDDGGTTTWTSKDGKTVDIGDKHVVIERTADGSAGHHAAAMKHNELLRLTLGLFLTAPQGIDVSYTFGGESDVDGTACNIVNAAFGGSSFKIYLGKSSNLPVMMSYTGHKMPQIMTFRHDGAKTGAETKDTTVFTRKIEGPAPETAEFNVRFSDYRSTGGIQLPYKWTQTVGGAADETFDVTSYEVNPANIEDKFNNQNVKVRVMKKPDGQ